MAEVAIIGSGIAGLSCAWWLTECGHAVTVYAGGEHTGGHSNTIIANTVQGKPVPVDVGFVAFNNETYPNLRELFQLLHVPIQRCDMSFGVSLYGGAIEYSAGRLTGLLAQPSQLLSIEHWRMITDILRFYKDAPALLEGTDDPSLHDYLIRNNYSDGFVSRHLVPIAAAIWSMPPTEVINMPARQFIKFCQAHKILQLKDRPYWYTVSGGSAEYIKRLTAKFADRILPRAATRVKRTKAGPLVESNGTYRPYDAVVMACHADEALALVVDPTENEQSVLGAFRFTEAQAVLHQDDELMPIRGGAWASWNYLSHPEGKASLTYWLNNLQDIDDETPLFLTINPPTQPRAELTLAAQKYMVPLFDQNAFAAQPYLQYLQGHGGIWYCGAWTGFGLHEDGLTSGLTVAEYLTGQHRPWAVRETSPAAGHVRPMMEAAEAA